MEELRKIRLEKLKRILSSGLNPYPQSTKRTHKISEALEKFAYFSREKKEVVLVGRIKSLRIHGKLTFFHFEDGTGKMQALLRSERVGENGYKFFLENFDIGDFVELRGTLMKTKKGERTIDVSDFKILAKSLLPLPEKWHGLKDIEERFRKRYLDLIFNPEVKKKFEIRANIIRAIRQFLEKEGFLEVETPILQPLYGGAKARPFKTHLNAFNMDVFLRIAPELYLKRLLVGGFEKVYEIGKCFRNEGVDRMHNPDFTMLEAYFAYASYKDLMKMVERMFEYILKKVFGKLKISYEGKEINFKRPWPRIEFFDLIEKYTKIKVEEIHLNALIERAKQSGIEVKKGAGKAEILDEIYKKFCRQKIWQPTFIIHHPKGKTSLAKSHEKDPQKLASFQLVAGGWELVWGYSELNDPIQQRKGFEEQVKLFEAGFEEAEARQIDEDYLEALEYGMPPAAGLGMGIDRLTCLLTNSHSLREVILFPMMRPK